MNTNILLATSLHQSSIVQYNGPISRAPECPAIAESARITSNHDLSISKRESRAEEGIKR
ncbi:MAG: hypothetical protein QW837_02665 [Conexivisphaerales archaeon]